MVVKSESESYGVCSVMSFMQNRQRDEAAGMAEVKGDRFEPSADVLSSRSRNLNMPTKSYIDNVIEKALKNIKNGENVAENRRILNIFSNIAGENPVEKELKSYI